MNETETRAGQVDSAPVAIKKSLSRWNFTGSLPSPEMNHGPLTHLNAYGC
jgi:hypothetical protein